MAELRYLTILFADLAGYTALSERLDPERLRDLQLGYQGLALAVIEAHGGFVASFRGDGVLAYFGYPTSTEADAERAVRAALVLVERLPDLALNGLDTSPLAVRIGLHTGLVAVGPEPSSASDNQHSIVGEAANIAARLQAEAPSDAVVVSRETLELVEGLFEAEALGPKSIRGLSRVIFVHRILRPRLAVDRRVRRRKHSAARFVGRQDELRVLLSHWDVAREERRCRLVEVIGEPGVGKTRLVSELCATPNLHGALVLQAAHLEMFAASPLFAVANMLWARVGLTAEDDALTMRRRIVALLEGFGLSSPDTVEVAAGLLGLATKGPEAGVGSSPPLLRRQQFELVCSLVESSARQRPILLWIEDAHWIDPSSAELLRLLLVRLAALPVFIVVTRRAYPKPAGLPTPEHSIALNPLSRASSIELAGTVPGARALEADMLALAVEVGDGIPLFIEQMTLSLLRDDASPAPTTGPRKAPGLPLTLAEMLSARLDRLTDGRRVVQAAACIGRPFSAEFLGALAGIGTAEVAQILDALIEAEILRASLDSTDRSYEFRHALLQRVARESMLQADQRAAHRRIAGLLRERRDNYAPTPPEIIAHHLTQAECFTDAVEAWLQAGAAAARRSAHAEAIEHLRNGLRLLPHVGDPMLRPTLEVKLLAQLVAPITAAQGSTAVDLATCCRRGLELCSNGPPSPVIFPFIYGLFTYTICRGRVAEAIGLARLFLETAQRSGFGSGEVIGHRLLGMALATEGQVVRAREHVVTSLGLYQAERDAATAHVFSQDAFVHGSALLSNCLLVLGELEEAARVGIAALERAALLGHPHSMAIALTYCGGFGFGFCGATEQLTQASRQLLELSEQHQLGIFRNFGEGFLGWALCLNGDVAEGCAAITAAATALEAVDYHLGTAVLLALSAEAQIRMGRRAEARDLCERAVAMARGGGNRNFEPEVLRLVAGVHHRLDPEDRERAVASLRDAIRLARELKATFFEFRCLSDLQILDGPASDIDVRLGELEHMRHQEQRARQLIGEWGRHNPSVADSQGVPKRPVGMGPVNALARRAYAPLPRLGLSSHK